MQTAASVLAAVVVIPLAATGIAAVAVVVGFDVFF